MTQSGSVPTEPVSGDRSIALALAWLAVALAAALTGGLARTEFVPDPLDYVLYQGSVVAAAFVATRATAHRRFLLAVTGALATLFMSVFLFIHMACPSP